jgi:hypothetical protein
MLIILGFALLVLAGGMVVLFAMFGELSVRVAETGLVKRSTEVRPLDKARLGHVPASWPPVIGQPGAGAFTLLVLSSACTSCADIATQLTEDPGHADWADMGVLISTASKERGEEFVASYGLSRFPHYIDDQGEWVSGEFDVRFSPSALVLRDGRLAEAYMFHDVAALRATLNQAPASARRASEKEAAWTERTT